MINFSIVRFLDISIFGSIITLLGDLMFEINSYQSYQVKNNRNSFQSITSHRHFLKPSESTASFPLRFPLTLTRQIHPFCKSANTINRLTVATLCATRHAPPTPEFGYFRNFCRRSSVNKIGKRIVEWPFVARRTL